MPELWRPDADPRLPHRSARPDGRVWVGEWGDTGVEEQRWTAFGPDGAPAFRVVLPASATPMDAAGDRLVVLDRTELTEEVVRVFTLTDPA